MKDIIISIINYNGQENTMDCLLSLNKALQIERAKIFVLDNNSDKPFVLDKSEIHNLDVEVIYCKKNFGYTGGHNEVIKRSK